ncbi:MAG: Panacea domain-containing protein [Pseudomonadota bacterium]
MNNGARDQVLQMQFDREKMRAVILRTCHACKADQLGAVKLNKVLYYLDMIQYAHWRQPVTGATYRKRPNGPTTDQLLFVLREMQNLGQIDIRQVNYHGYLKTEYVPLVEAPQGILNEAEEALLNDVIEFVCVSNSARSISEYSHTFPWEMAEMGGVIPYHSAMLLFPMQPSPEAFEMAEQEARDVEAARSESNTVDLPLLSAFRERILQAAGQR